MSNNIYTNNWTWTDDAYKIEEDSYKVSLFIQNYIITIIKLIACVLIVGNNTLLVYAISKFERRQTRTNNILINLAVITSALSIISTVDSLLAAFVVGNIHALLFIKAPLYLLLQLSFILSALLTIDWFIVSNFKDLCSTYEKMYKWVIGISYVIPLIFFILSFIAGYHYISALNIFVFVFFCIGIIVILIINVIKHYRTYNHEDLNSSYIVTVSNIYFLMWLPCIATAICLYIGPALYSTAPGFRATLILVFISQCLNIFALSAPIVMTWVLINRDKNFKVSYDAIFNRSGNSYVSAHKTDDENL